MLSVAELENLIRQYTSIRNQKLFGPDLTMDEFHPNIDEIQQAIQARVAVEKAAMLSMSVADAVIDIGLGRTRRLPGARFVHRCGNCAETWASSVRSPKKCPRSREDLRGPKCGTSRWREITKAGLERARQQERRWDIETA